MALVGRPNVGKSTLFNRIVGERTAIVEDRARTTRDRLYAVAEWNGRRFIVVDTGGLEQRPGDQIEAKVQEQARLAIAEADVIVFVVDAGVGETPADQEAAELLRRSRVPILVAVNKADSERLRGAGRRVQPPGLGRALHPQRAARARHRRPDGRRRCGPCRPSRRPRSSARRRRSRGGRARPRTRRTSGPPRRPDDRGEAAAAWDARVAADDLARGPISIAIVGGPTSARARCSTRCWARSGPS